MAQGGSRKQWAEHLAGRTAKALDLPPEHLKQKPFQGIILGVDPSLRGTGLAVVDVQGGSHRLLESMTVRSNAKSSQAECLGAIHRSIAEFLKRHHPLAAAFEETIFVQNFKTAQIMGMARGAALAAAAQSGVSISEYAPLRIKQAVVGFGRASKAQVAGMTRQLLCLKEALPEDEADAAAAALCHAFTAGG